MAARRDSSSQSKFRQVADESVVVSKFRPEKASNGVEGKTGMTWVKEYSGLQYRQNPAVDAKGGSFYENLSETRRRLKPNEKLSKMTRLSASGKG